MVDFDDIKGLDRAGNVEPPEQPKQPEEQQPSSYTVTKIQVQKRRKDRFNVFLNGSYAFPVSEAVLVKTGLRKDLVLSPEELAEIKRLNAEQDAYTAAVDYLSYSLRSEKEVREKLREEDIPPEAIDTVIERLKSQLYINDRIYGESYTRTAANINRKGPLIIAQELKGKGLNQELIDEVLLQYPEADQRENAVKLAEKQLKKQHRSSAREAANKTRLYLQQKGYPREVVDEVMAAIDTEKPEDEEWEALKQQGEKAWTRYARKAEGHELQQKVRASLYQKGFPGDLISRFIDEKKQELDEV